MEGGGEGTAKVGLLVEVMSAWTAEGERADRGTTVPQMTTDIACRNGFEATRVKTSTRGSSGRKTNGVKKV